MQNVGCLGFDVFGTVVDWRSGNRAPGHQRNGRVPRPTAGFRGAVSLAAALAVPATLASGQPFPGRDTIVFVTAGVIVVTLALQAPLLPVVVRWARLPEDTSVAQERHLAETIATREDVRLSPNEIGVAVKAYLRSVAIDALDRVITTPTWLAESWEATPDGPAWRRTISELRKLLDPPPHESLFDP